MRHLEPRLRGDPKQSGQWWMAGNSVLWSCPSCGQAHKLVTHTINDDEELTPSVVCGKCDFHEYVALEDVSPEARDALSAKPL